MGQSDQIQLDAMMKLTQIPSAVFLALVLNTFAVFVQGAEAGAGPAADVSTLAKPRSGNPVFNGWYADPEAVIFGDRYWIYPTYSAPYNQQVFFDAFSSPDLVHWTKHSRILSTNQVTWARRAMWAPAVVQRNGKYFFLFGANDIHDEQKEIGGIGVAVADAPEGPFRDLLGKPLVNQIRNGAQPIDQFVFQDRDGQDYLIYGGWSHCNIARLKPDFTGLLTFPDGSTFKEITPENYVEGSFMFLKDGKYYFMWSEGGWTGPNYSVAYAIANSPLGPFKRIGKVLQQDPAIATGAGHHSVIHVPGSDRWYIVYHRRPLGETNPNHRVTCIDEMHFDENGFIKPVKITNQGVEPHPLGSKQ
jgi:beta-xylosidase